MEKKLVFVTGASRGIGKGIASQFLESGYDVALGYHSQKTSVDEFSKSYHNALALQLDIANRSSIQTAIRAAENHFKRPINILVNNAAIAQEKQFETITDLDWDQMLAVNLRGAFAFSQELLPGMVKQNWGRIINMTSIGGQWGGVNQVHYAVAKSGLIGLTRSLARLYSQYRITINAVAPGLVKTDMIANELNTSAGQQKLQSIPIGRIATVEEIAEVVMFLAGEGSRYITGQTVNVNGGMYFG